jgi:hypothetical protein
VAQQYGYLRRFGIVPFIESTAYRLARRLPACDFST